MGNAVVPIDCGAHRSTIEQIDINRCRSRGTDSISLGVGSNNGCDGVARCDQDRHDTTTQHTGCSSDEHPLTHRN